MTKAELEAKNHELRTQIIALRNIIQDAPRLLIAKDPNNYGSFHCIESYDPDDSEDMTSFISDPGASSDFQVCSLPTDDAPDEGEAMEVAIIPVNMISAKVTRRGLLPEL